MDLEAELKKIQMIEEDEIRKGKSGNIGGAKDGAKKKNKGSTGDKSQRGNQTSSRVKEDIKDQLLSVQAIQAPLVKQSSKNNITGQPRNNQQSSASIIS